MKIISKMAGIASMAAVGILTVLGPMSAAGDDYPAKPVTIHVGMNPGGGSSITAQVFAEGVQKHLAKPQPFILNHKPGASGLVAADYFMKQPADGYNLLWFAPDTPLRMALEPQKFSFKKEDFSYIGILAYAPFTLAVNSESPFKSLEEFIEYAKKHPNEITFSTPGIATGGHFTAEVFMKEVGIKMTHVPFVAGTQAMLAMLGKHVTCTFMTSGLLGSHIKPGGKGRALVLFDDKRIPELPDLPTIKEKGYDIVRHSWYTMAAKKGTPKPVLDTLARLFKQTAEDPGVQSAIVKAAHIPSNLGPEETEKRVFQDFDMAREIFAKLGLLEK